MMSSEFKKDHSIKLADHARTVVVEGKPHSLKDVARDIRKIQNGGHFEKVSIIKVKGLRVDRLRITLGQEHFDKLFVVQAEYLHEKEHYVIMRSNNRNLPIGRPLMFSSPPVHIRPKKIKVVRA